MRIQLFIGLALSSLSYAQTSLSPSEAVRRALANRPAVGAGWLHIDEARRLASAMSAYPATRLEAGRNLINEVDIGGGPDLLLYQPLDIFGKSAAARSQGQAQVAVAMAAYWQSALDVQHETLLAYSNVNSDQRLLSLATTQFSLATAMSETVDKRVAARDLPEVQAIRAQLEVDRASQLVDDRKAAVEASRIRLEGALGVNELGPVLLSSLLTPNLDSADPSRKLPELLALSAEQDAARADLNVARRAWLPDLEIQAGRNSFDQPGQYNARLELSFNLLDHGANRNQQMAAEARQKAVAATIQDRRAAILKAIAAARVELAAAEKSLLAYQKLAEGATGLLAKTKLGFGLGASTLVDMIDARRTLSDAEELSSNAMLRRDLAIEDLLNSEGLMLVIPK